ncbi:MAG: hypothetical protein IPJ65_39710 [Archangiaceae bacterium]|nr:hypothetical protein [Archangiaceae bacterium]
MRVSVVIALLGAGCMGAPHGVGVGGGGEGGGGDGTGGGSSSGGGGGGFMRDGGLPLGDACTVLDAKRCDYLARCGLIDDSADGRRDCLAWLTETWCGPMRWPAHVAAGALVYDSRAGQECADAWAARACEDYESLPVACNRLTAPNVPPQRSGCFDNYLECVESLVCRGAACPRTCLPLGMAGDVCLSDSDCRALLYCKRGAPVSTCTNLGSVNAVCSKDDPCTPGLSCAGGRCIQPPPIGQPCAASGVCDVSAWCSPADGGVCALRETSGSSCSDDAQCASGFICQLGSCQPRVLALVGTDCSDKQTCPGGTLCINATATTLGLCGSPLDAGVACIASDDCKKHLSCPPADAGASCAQRRDNHERCVVDRDCQLLSRCKGGVCVRLPPIGESCLESRACAAGPCAAQYDGGFLCVEKYGAQVRCGSDSDCASNRCVNAVCLAACAP